MIGRETDTGPVAVMRSARMTSRGTTSKRPGSTTFLGFSTQAANITVAAGVSLFGIARTELQGGAGAEVSAATRYAKFAWVLRGGAGARMLVARPGVLSCLYGGSSRRPLNGSSLAR